VSDTCGCCTPNAPITPVAIDNRPGLSAIAYRVGTYGSFRETMLDAIAATPELADLTTRQDDDDAITFIDLWAGLLDVLTFYQERYANEVFLRTAQQPESLRRLARLLDYRPRPGVAALANLAFTLDAGKTVQIPVGLRVQSMPAQNQQPQTYETLQAITADARFNRLRIFPQPTPVNPLQQGSSAVILDRLDGPAFLTALSANDPMVLFNDGGSDAPEEKKVAALTVADDMVTLSWTKPIQGANWNADTKGFKFRRTFRPFGYNAPASYMQSSTSDTVPGGILWTLTTTDFSNPGGTQLNLDSRYSDLATGSQLLIVMPAPPPPPPPVPLPFPLPGGLGGGFGGGILSGGSGGGSGGGGTSGGILGGFSGGLGSFLGGIDPGTIFGAFAGGAGVQTFLATITQSGQAGASLGGISDTVTQVTLDVSLPAIKDIRQVRVFELVGDPLRFWGNVYADTLSAGTAYLPGRFVATANGIGIEVGRTIQQNAFVPGAVIGLNDLDVGRSLVLADGHGQTAEATVQGPALSIPSAPSAGDFGHLVVPLQADALSLEATSAVLLGNVARASQGQTVLSEVVGSGDAAAKFQSFTLQRQPLTYVPSSAPGGVTSSLQLFVNQLQWTEVPEIFGQPRSAQVFSTRTTDDGKTLIQGGGGPFGAPFPTGTANITATYRVGTGSAGRVDANALVTLLDRPPGLISVTNPLPAEGGADPETLQTIRQNAPHTVRTFDRAVSLQDFQDLITTSGEVAKALATWVWDGFAPAVHLTVAGQGGSTFADLTGLGATLANARDPNQRLLIDNYTKVPIRLAAKVWVDPARAQADVLAAATAAVLDALSFDELDLGEALHLSFIYAVLQSVSGVVAADVTGFGFKSDAIPFLLSRGVTFLPNGSVAPVQDFLRIFAARPDPARPGQVVPAELAFVETPAQDVAITAQGA
jgi:uncharacterized phage protein gp47/JayE